MRTALLLLAVALAVVGCSVSSGTSSSASGTPTPTDSASSLPAGCAGEPLDVTDLVAATQGAEVQPVACYGSTPLTFEANWVGGGVADCPTAPEPAWLACSPFSLRAAGDTRKVGAPELFVAIDPAIGTMPDNGTDVAVTGHFDASAAQTCHDTGPSEESPGPVGEAVERCRNTFVVTDLSPM